jgi:hypothetical protein
LDQQSYRLLCLTGYFEGILKMKGASGLSQVIAPSRKYGDKKIPVVTATPIDPAAAPEAAPAPPPAPAPPAPVAAAEAAPAPPARTDSLRVPRVRGGTKD